MGEKRRSDLAFLGADPGFRRYEPRDVAAPRGSTAGRGIRREVDYLRGFPDEAIDGTVRQASQVTSPFSAVVLCPLGGAVSGVDRETMVRLD
jgi:hypothetical protein